MRRPLFAIASLVCVLVILAIGLTALRSATDAWDSGVFGFILALLLTSVLLIIHRAAERRAFWLGFALFGWAYLVMSLVPPIEVRLPTTSGLAFLDSLGPFRAITLTNVPNGTTGGPGTLVTTFSFASDGPWNGKSQGDPARFLNVVTRRFVSLPNGTWENFMRIGHSLIALVMGVFGGYLSRWLYNRNSTQRTDEPTISTAPDPNPEVA